MIMSMAGTHFKNIGRGLQALFRHAAHLNGIARRQIFSDFFGFIVNFPGGVVAGETVYGFRLDGNGGPQVAPPDQAFFHAKTDIGDLLQGDGFADAGPLVHPNGQVPDIGQRLTVPGGKPQQDVNASVFFYIPADGDARQLGLDGQGEIRAGNAQHPGFVLVNGELEHLAFFHTS